jgi:hypothetical protein
MAVGGPRAQDNNPGGGLQKGNFGGEPTWAGVDERGKLYAAPRMEFADEGLAPGKTYVYEVATVNWSDLASARSAPLTVKTEAGKRP